jgi:hypothetical protein
MASTSPLLDLQVAAVEHFDFAITITGCINTCEALLTRLGRHEESMRRHASRAAIAQASPLQAAATARDVPQEHSCVTEAA